MTKNPFGILLPTGFARFLLPTTDKDFKILTAGKTWGEGVELILVNYQRNKAKNIVMEDCSYTGFLYLRSLFILYVIICSLSCFAEYSVHSSSRLS